MENKKITVSTAMKKALASVATADRKGSHASVLWFEAIGLALFAAYGNLVSFNWRDIVDAIQSIRDDIIDYLTNYYSGDTPWTDLDYMVDADDDDLFNEDFEEVEDDDDDDDGE